MGTLISGDDHASLWALIATGTALSIGLEQRFRWAARLSAPVLALLIAMVLANSRVMPVESAAYDFVGNWLVPLAIPLLLFRANLREIIRNGGRTVLVLHLGVAGTILGTLLAHAILGARLGAPAAAHAAGIMAASYTGGSVNFMAVKTSYAVPASITSPLIVADNFVMAGIFVALLAMAGSRWLRARYPHPHSVDSDRAAAGTLAAQHWSRKGISLRDVAIAMAFACIVLALARLLGGAATVAFSAMARPGLGWQMLQVLCTNPYVLLTGVSLTLATLFARPLAGVNGPDEFGMYLLSLFLFTLGLPADLVGVLTEAPLFFVFCGIIAGTNLVFTLVAGKLLRLQLEELLLAVNATLGGAPSAAAMAISAGWPRLVVPGILAGIWGYVIGTPIGVLMVEWLR
jgi:uncharacterized membrane protein